jgi:hypothetical protein
MKVVKIKVNKKELEQLLSKHITKDYRNALVKRFGEGFCSKCENYATYKTLVPSDNATIITRYCDKHWSQQIWK